MAEQMMAVKFQFKSTSSFVIVVMEQSKANALARSFLANEWKLRGQPVAGDVDCPAPWSVRLDEVVSVQVLPGEALQGMQQPFKPLPGPFPPTNLSGL